MKPIYDPLLGKMRTELTAGAGLDISGGTISTITPPDGVPYVAGDGVAIDGATIYSDLTGLDRIEVDGGTITYNPIADIVTVSGSAVTLNPDTAYKIQATTQAVTLNANVPASGKWGLDGHAEIFVAGTGYVVTGANVVLATPLEPDAVNNCTLRFHDGLCIISVEDHVAGYIVVSATGTTSGSLPYGISSATQEYIAVDASLNGTTIDLSGSTANGEKHIVGNGYTSTTLTGAVNCGTSKFTVANLALSDVQVTGGVMTLGDAYIPSGSTVAVSGGGLAIEKVTGNGGVVDLDGVCNIQLNKSLAAGASATASATISGIVIKKGTTTQYGGGIQMVSSSVLSATSCSIESCYTQGGAGLYMQTGATAVFTDCTFAHNSNTNTNQAGAAFLIRGGANATFIGCNFENNSATGSLKAGRVQEPGTIVTLSNCQFGESQGIAIDGSSATIICSGSNAINLISKNTTSAYGTVSITSGAVVDLTGNTNATPIAPGGGIVFESGGATVYPSAGSASAYALGGMTVPQIGNTNVVNLNSSNVVIGSGGTAYASGCTFTGGSAVSSGGAFSLEYGYAKLVLDSCVVSGNTAPSYGQDIYTMGSLDIINSVIGDCRTAGGYGSVTIVGSNTIGNITKRNDVATVPVIISSGASINLTSSIAPGGGITVLEGGCTVNGNAIAAGTYTSIDSTGTPTE